jgi:asparagine synthase (glutamine-hydrolysing)
MWAFALWDATKRELFCSRDRFGEKPLFYAFGDDWLVFGSEIKALLANPRVNRRPNDAMVYDFLSLKLADHTNDTFFDGISRLPAAHNLTFRPGRAPVLDRYWDTTAVRPLDGDPAGEAGAIARFRELFEDAVRIRLRADVPIGTCLSGGVDSSSIAVTANRLMFDELHLPAELVGERQRTFSACFDDARFDERPHIDRVIAATGARTHRVFPSGDRLWDELPALVAQMDEPFHSTSQYSQYSVMRLVREHDVTVTLDGQGADELMAGYPGYHGVMLATMLRAGRVRAAAREGYATWKLSGRGRSTAELAARAAYGLAPTALTTPIRTLLAPHFASRTPEGRLLQLIRPELQERYGDRRLAWIEDRAGAMRDLGRKLYDDVHRFSLPVLLRYADRNSMAFSIESRLPLLDHRLAEHIFSLPLTMMMRGGWSKWVFRTAMQGRLPEAIQWRKDKLGFVTPEGVWLRAGKDRLTELLSGPMRCADYLDVETIRRRLAKDVAATSTSAFYTDVFRWYVLELWMRYAFGPP